MTNFFATNWLSIVSIVTGAVTSWIISWFYFRKGVRNKAISFTTNDISVIWPTNQGKDDSLKITYQGNEVPRVTSTTMAIWNSGTETIDGSDIVADDPLRLIAAEGVKILRVQVLEKTRDVIVGDIPNISEKQANVRFRYLDANDGIAVEVLHTGGMDAISVAGAIKGIPRGVTTHDRDKVDRWIFSLLMIVFAPSFIITFIIACFLPIYIAYSSWSKPWPKNAWGLGMAFTLVIIYIVALKPDKKKLAEPLPNRIKGVPDSLASKLGLRTAGSQ